MRPVTRLFIVFLIVLAAQLWILQVSNFRRLERGGVEQEMIGIVTALGLSDLCIATDARYIRNPAVTDQLAPYMDHPGDIEHFPTGSFWTAGQ